MPKYDFDEFVDDVINSQEHVLTYIDQLAKEYSMALKLVRKKKPKKAAGRTKKTEVEKFADAIAVQLRIAGGETVSKGRGVAKSWMVDGDAFGQKDKVLVPMIGRLPLHSKSGYTVNMSQAKPPTAELRELLAIVKSGKLSNKIYSVIRAQKKNSKK